MLRDSLTLVRISRVSAKLGFISSIFDDDTSSTPHCLSKQGTLWEKNHGVVHQCVEACH